MKKFFKKLAKSISEFFRRILRKIGRWACKFFKKLAKSVSEFFRRILRKIGRWACAEELEELDNIRYMLGGGKVAISADIHQNTDSWAVISIKGKERDYVKFINMGRQQIMEIAQFLRRYEDAGGRIGAIDASPMATRILKDNLWL